MMVFIEPTCTACERVVATAGELHRMGVVERPVIVNRTDDPSACEAFGVFAYPSTFVNGHLAFHGEFSPEDFLNFYIRKE